MTVIPIRTIDSPIRELHIFALEKAQAVLVAVKLKDMLRDDGDQAPYLAASDLAEIDSALVAIDEALRREDGR